MGGRVQNTRVKLFQEQKGKCYYCARPMLLIKGHKFMRPPPHMATLDHIIPLAEGGARGPTINGVCACYKCNTERGTRDARIFLLEKMGLA